MKPRPGAHTAPDDEWTDGDGRAADEGGDGTPGQTRAGGVADVLAALPGGQRGRVLKLAVLDALEASARADAIALPVEVKGLRARVRAGRL